MNLSALKQLLILRTWIYNCFSFSFLLNVNFISPYYFSAILGVREICFAYYSYNLKKSVSLYFICSVSIDFKKKQINLKVYPFLHSFWKIYWKLLSHIFFCSGTQIIWVSLSVCYFVKCYRRYKVNQLFLKSLCSILISNWHT